MKDSKSEMFAVNIQKQHKICVTNKNITNIKRSLSVF